ncbi:hypothetical protein EHI8A_049910 [Entamoeba histolytica HM-1:IMSS-B]|nr:hypothetical protein EHI8A_049910 [Entamoeba histolytica HM-1:IMSS-B]
MSSLLNNKYQEMISASSVLNDETLFLLKKFQKSNETTIIKTLDELKRNILLEPFISTKKEQQAFSLHFSNIFTTLSTHKSSNVRLNLFICLSDGILQSPQGKNMISFCISEIIPWWLLCCHDSVKEISEAAKKALNILSFEGRQKVITSNISQILRLVSSNEYDLISRMGCLATILPNINISKLSSYGKSHLENSIKSLIESYGSITNEVYFSSIDAALITCNFIVMERFESLKNIIVKTIDELQPFSKYSKQLFLCITSLLENGAIFNEEFYNKIIQYISTACLGSLYVFPTLKRLLPFIKEKELEKKYIEGVFKAIGDSHIRGPQRAVVILHYFESIKYFKYTNINELIEIMKLLLNDPGSIMIDSGYSSMGIFLTKLNETKEIQGVLSSAVTYLRRSEEKEYLIHLNCMKFIVDKCIKNEFTQGFSYDLLKTIIDKNENDHFFNDNEIDLIIFILQKYPATEEVHQMIVRQFQHIFMLSIEENINEFDIINDTVEINDEFLSYVIKMEDLLIQSISFEPSTSIGYLLNQMFFNLFPKHYALNHLNYLRLFINKLKEQQFIQTIVLQINPLIQLLLHSFKSSKDIVQSIISISPRLLTPQQLTELLFTNSINHLQVLLNVDLINYLIKSTINSKELLLHIIKSITSPDIFLPIHQPIRNVLLKLLPSLISYIGIEPIHEMLKSLLLSPNCTSFCISLTSEIPPLRNLLINDIKLLLPLSSFISLIPSYAQNIKSPLLIPMPFINSSEYPHYNNTLSLLVKLYHLNNEEIKEDNEYIEYWLFDSYQKLTNRISVEIPHLQQLILLQYLFKKNEIEQYLIFHIINQLSSWINLSKESIEYLAHLFDSSTSYSIRFFLSTYLSPLHIDWLEKKVNIIIKKFFMVNTQSDPQGLKELSILYPLIFFPTHLKMVFKYIFSLEITSELELPFLHILHYVFSSSCSLCFESLENEESLSLIYQFLLKILTSSVSSNLMKRGALQVSQILITHSLPPKLLTSESEGIQLSFKISLIDFIVNSIINKSNTQLISELLLQTDLLAEIDFMSDSMRKYIPELFKILKGKDSIIVKICTGYLIGASMNFKSDETFIDFDDNEQQKYHPLPPSLEEYLDKAIESFSQFNTLNKTTLIIFILGMLRKIKDSSTEYRSWIVAYLQAHHFELFINNLYTLLPDQHVPLTLSSVLSLLHSFINGEDEDENQLLTKQNENQILNILASYCMFVIVQSFPNVVRQWCLSLRKSAPKMVKKFFERNICPFILQEEVQKILSWKETDDFILRLQLDGKAVTVVYKNDELVFESQLIFPSTYPLDMITVNVASNKVSVSEAKSHLYKRMLTMNLMTRDLGIIDACLLWKQQLDRQFDNSDACPICYSLFYLRTTTIPNVACKCCRKKFHKQCIFGWFRSTGRHDCPLCTRNFYGENKN